MQVSFYKMFGFPTGIGALVLRPGIAEWLRESRVWFAGGTVGVVQVPGTVRGWSGRVEECFEVRSAFYPSFSLFSTLR